MNCRKLLYVLLVFLVVINIGLVYLHFFSDRRHHHHDHDSSTSWLTKSLNLTEEQSAQHVKMRKQYFSDLRILNDSIKQIKARFIALTAKQDLSDSLLYYWTDSINRWHRRADERSFNYIRAARGIMQPNQQPDFDSLIRLTIIRRHRDDD